jgi:uncharacterized DUF497 family protein
MGQFPDELAACTGFDWDAGNAGKNDAAHHVTDAEAEEVFFNRPLLIAPDLRHSVEESRIAALGKTARGRHLSIVFTLRGNLVRIISARDMSRKERRYYGKI